MPRLSKLEREIKRPGDWLLDRKERLERVQTETVRSTTDSTHRIIACYFFVCWSSPLL